MGIMEMFETITASAPASWIIAVAIALISYLIGSINFSIILSLAISGKDIRESGSGNAGATNMLRTHGKGMGVLTLLLDVLKGILAIVIAILFVKFSNDSLKSALDALSVKYIAGLFVIVGHNFPLYFCFKGGKGVATSLGVLMMLDWKIGLIILVIALLIMIATRYVSLGSIIAAALFIVLALSRMFFDNDWNIFKILCVVLIGAIVILRHHANIKRLLNGTENKLGAKKEN